MAWAEDTTIHRYGKGEEDANTEDMKASITRKSVS
jgi:hypothetical protein